jgi:hypothetical protein
MYQLMGYRLLVHHALPAGCCYTLQHKGRQQHHVIARCSRVSYLHTIPYEDVGGLDVPVQDRWLACVQVQQPSSHSTQQPQAFDHIRPCQGLLLWGLSAAAISCGGSGSGSGSCCCKLGWGGWRQWWWCTGQGGLEVMEQHVQRASAAVLQHQAPGAIALQAHTPTAENSLKSPYIHSDLHTVRLTQQLHHETTRTP